MTSRDFAFWLQGLFELQNPVTLDEKQTDLIKRHLNLVFKHDIDPSMGPKEHQDKLNNIHLGIPQNFNEAVQVFGLPPSDEHEFNMHGWYHPDEGQPRC